MGKYTSDWQKPYVEKNKRFDSFCVYCGKSADSREHIPSRVFLDEPYSNDMAVVPACSRCNSDYSYDEEFVACYLDVLNSTMKNSNKALRVKTKQSFNHSQALKTTIYTMIEKEDESIKFNCPNERIERIITELAIGHLANFCDRQADKYSFNIRFSFAPTLSEDARNDFNRLEEIHKTDELMNDSIDNILVFEGFDGNVFAFMPWVEVQPKNYRYQTYYNDDIDALVVKIVIFEFLYAEVHCKIV